MLRSASGELSGTSMQIIPDFKIASAKIEAVGSLDDDVYITSMDAEKVRNAEKSFGVLSNCRVMLLLQ